MSRLAGLILLAWLIAGPLAAQDAQSEVPDLIARLGSDQWAVREKAQRRLVAIGEPARAKLREALTSTDPEVRARASAAMISLGESFAYALKCAESGEPGPREHGKAALLNLFGLLEGKSLADITADELSRSGYGRRAGYNNQPAIACPPALAIATLEAMSGFPLVISAGAQLKWETFLQATTVPLDVSPDYTQLQLLMQQVNALLTRALGAEFARDGALVLRPMRIGQLSLVFVCTPAEQADASGACALQLVTQFIAGGQRAVQVARLLAAAVSMDPAALARLQNEAAAPDSAAELLFVALHTEWPEAGRQRLSAFDPQLLKPLLASRNWRCLQAAAAMLRLSEEASRLALLDELVQKSNDSLELLAALWCARGCELSPEARVRVARCVTSNQDGIAAAAARWFAGAATISDDELKLAWKSAEVLPVNSAFFPAALELFTRDDVRPRLLASARELLSGRFDTQQALAAAVLKGQASSEDLARVLERLNTAQDQVLGSRLIALFDGCNELNEAGIDRLAAGIFETDAQKRRRFTRVLRLCDQALRKTILDAAEEKIAAAETKFGGKEKAAGLAHIIAGRQAIIGLRAGLGDSAALDALLETLRTGNTIVMREAASALVDAVSEAGLSSTLSALKKAVPLRFVEIGTAVYLEQCRRAVESGNREAFRVASTRVSAIQTDRLNWQLQDQLAQLENLLDVVEGRVKKAGLLPSNPFLKSLKVE